MRPRPTHSSACATTLAATAIALFAWAGPAGASATAQAIYDSALKTAGSQSVHFVSAASDQGTSLKVVGDTGATSGSQSLVVSKGKMSEKLTITLVGATGYLNGNSTALENIIGLTTAQGTKYSGKWLSFPTSNASLGQLVSGLHDQEVTTELKLTGPLTFGRSKTINGQRATAIKGTVGTSAATQVPAVLYVAASGTPHPLEEDTNPTASTAKSTAKSTAQ
ncbi:MAG TPA: hypothetical protein VND70_02625, partial [Acidimicrobiales bacterium]|nr:hypothetical protein [Acidimicrobiales bacterium]